MLVVDQSIFIDNFLRCLVDQSIFIDNFLHADPTSHGREFPSIAKASPFRTTYYCQFTYLLLTTYYLLLGMGSEEHKHHHPTVHHPLDE